MLGTRPNGGIDDILFWQCGGFPGGIPDTNGDYVQTGVSPNAWHQRTLDMSRWAGCTIQTFTIGVQHNYTAGDGDLWLSDMAITSSDGTVVRMYYRQSSVPTELYGASSNAANGSLTIDSSTVPGSSTMNYATTFYAGDHLGTAQMELASGGWPVWKGTFSPYGQELSTLSTPNHYKFTGKERDTESGLDYFGARYYASSMGRWMSPDWAEKAQAVPYANLMNPQSLNLYAYVGNNPVSNVDSDGHAMAPHRCDHCVGPYGTEDPVGGWSVCAGTGCQSGYDQQTATLGISSLAQQQNTSSTATTNPNATAEQHQYDLVVNRTNKLLGTDDAADHIDPDGKLDGGNYAFPINNNDKSDTAFQRSLNSALGEVTDKQKNGEHGGLFPPTHRVGFSTSLHHDDNALHVDHFNGAKFPVGTLLHAIVDVGIGHLAGPNFAFSYAGVQQ